MKTLIALLFTVSAAFDWAAGQAPDPNVFCFECMDRRNQKDLYADPSNCHFYYQCFYINDNIAIGIRRPCPAGTFWHDQILQCLPEGTVPCQDSCSSPNTASGSCYGSPDNCATFYVCSNGASYQFCCPQSTAFNPSTCNCDLKTACTDVCTQPSSIVQPTAGQPTNNGTVCEDGYGNLFQAVPDNSQKFQQIDVSNPADIRYTIFDCAPGTSFELNLCQCSGLGPIAATPVSQKQCKLYMPFDGNFNDMSTNHFVTDAIGNAQIDSGNKAVGTGSLYVKNGRVEVAGLKNIDFQKQASFCLFFRCDALSIDPNTITEPYDCLVPGGLLSNSGGHGDYSIIMSANSQPTTKARVDARLSFSGPVGTTSVSNPVKAFLGFNQACVVYDGTNVKLYIDGELQPCVNCNEPTNGGELTIGQCPYTIGSDQLFGNFTGWIDEVLICPEALTLDEIKAHYQGDINYLISQGLLPQ